MYVRALKGYEEAWGPKHTSTLDTVYNLGNLYYGEGRLIQARKMYLRALEDYAGLEGNHQSDISYLKGQLSKLEFMDDKAQPCSSPKDDVLPGGLLEGRPPATSSLFIEDCGKSSGAESRGGGIDKGTETSLRVRKRDLLRRVLNIK